MLLSMHPARLPQYPYPTSALQSAATLHQRSSTYPNYCCDMTGTNASSSSYYYPSANIAAGVLNQQTTANIIYQQQQSYSSTPDPAASNDSPSPISTGYNSQSVVSSEYCGPESPHDETLPAKGSTFEQIYSESCCYSNHNTTASSDELNEEFETSSSAAGMEQQAINLDSPNESLSSPIVVEGSPQSPCTLNNGEELSPSDQSHLKLSPSSSDTPLISQQPPSTHNYDSSSPSSCAVPDTSTCNTPIDQQLYNRQQQQYYCSVGYGGTSNSTQLLYDSSYSSNSYDLSQYSSYGSSGSYGANGIGSYCNTAGSTLPAYYTNYYTSQQYGTGSSQPQSTAGCSTGLHPASTSTSSASAVGYSSDYVGGGYPYSSGGTIGSTITTGQQQGHASTSAYASLWNSYPPIGTPSGLSLTGGHQQYSKVSYDTPRFKLTPERAIPLIKWFEEHKDHPYPSRHEKMVLCQSTQLTFTQVSTWFANARRRMKKAANEDDELEDCIGGVSDDEKLK